MAYISLDFLHNYSTGERRESDPEAYQYDEGHVLEAVVPVAVTSCEIQYWIRGMEKADAYTPTSITQNTDNTYTILGNIPNSYFEINGDLRVYIVVTDGDASITTYEGYIHIKERQMPEDYVDDDPENEAVRVIAEARAAAATATQKAGEAAASAEQAQEIRDSIPEDYSQLSEDVSNLKEDLDSITGKRGLDSIAFGDKTYRDIFERNNLIPFGDFESGLGWISGNTNGAVISDDASYSRNHSLKCFGTSSVQIRKDIKSLSRIDIDIICKVKVDRYVSGGGAGFFYSDNKLINHVTDGWETVYQGRSTINANGTGSFFFGTVSAANCDAYIDDICVINLSGLWESSGNYPTQTKMKELYEEWIEIKNLRKKERNKKTYVGAVIDATDADARFKAMRQLLNIATAKSNDPGFDVPASAYTYASKGTVIELPENPSMYEKINVDALFSANGDVQAIPASTTKVMTLITGIDFIDNINEVITITSSDIQTGSGNVFEAGDTCTIKDLMYTMLLPSSNTGARAFARVCGKKILAYRGITAPTDQEAYNAFIAQMGVKASDIGMSNSVFDAASGLSSSNKTTTNDMIHMMIEACSYPEICKIWGKDSYTFSVGGQNPRSITVDTTVTDAGIESEYILLGGKTGHMYVDQSQACALVIVAKER